MKTLKTTETTVVLEKGRRTILARHAAAVRITGDRHTLVQSAPHTTTAHGLMRLIMGNKKTK